MNKKILVGMVVLLLLIVLGSMLYVFLMANGIEKDMREYINSEGYSEQEIHSIEVNHSFLNLLLSYNQWTIYVRFNDEPSVVYHYTIRNGEIEPAGVSGDINKDKEDLKKR